LLTSPLPRAGRCLAPFTIPSSLAAALQGTYAQAPAENTPREVQVDSARVRGATLNNYDEGLREASSYYTSRTRADPHTLERLEVLRGPSGMLLGAPRCWT
jgi:hypothetical protein